jgi:hypothetical protein
MKNGEIKWVNVDVGMWVRFFPAYHYYVGKNPDDLIYFTGKFLLKPSEFPEPVVHDYI